MAEEPTTTVSRSSITEAKVEPSGFTPYLGIGGGYTQYHKDIHVEGLPSSLKFLGSYYTENKNYVFDVGVGVMNQTFSQRSALKRTIADTTLEIAARYRWATSNWEAGLVEATFFNEGKYYSANQADAQFAGLQVLKGFNLTKHILARAGGRIMTDLNVNERAVNMAMIDLQLGWAANKGDTLAIATPSKTVTATETTTVVFPPTAEAATRPASTERRVVFPQPYEKLSERTYRELMNTNTLAQFDVNSAKLSNLTQKDIAKLSAILAKNSDLFEKVEIVGHADSSGTDEHNMELSKKRAEAVANVFMANGLNADHLVITGEGSSSQSNLQSQTPNKRRVEIRFIDVKDFSKLEKLIQAL
jgi:outer membrane protein OmpA-like peptidoglycan-associated protein